MDSLCCCCGDPMEGGEMVPITLAIPGEADVTAAAVICWHCTKDYELFPDVISALITAKITRLQYPYKRYTPE